PHDKLFLYGEAPYEKFILRFIRKNNLTNKIILCGYEKDKRKIYSNIDVLIDPAFAQGISNSNLEAMCTNTLVIASNVYGNRDLIKHKISGLLFNPYIHKSLLKQLYFLQL
ncbi:MAG: glycosyltransferase, partial [Candidatus Hodarchaeota archaeon]